MDPERRKWLEHVMESVFGQNIDPVKQMKSCLDVLASVEADGEQKTAALDALSALTEESMTSPTIFTKSEDSCVASAPSRIQSRLSTEIR